MAAWRMPDSCGRRRWRLAQTGGTRRRQRRRLARPDLQEGSGAVGGGFGDKVASTATAKAGDDLRQTVTLAHPPYAAICIQSHTNTRT